MTYKQEGSKWVVRSKSGRKLGSHPTKAGARKQLAAIEISKHKGKRKFRSALA